MSVACGANVGKAVPVGAAVALRAVGNEAAAGSFATLGAAVELVSGPDVLHPTSNSAMRNTNAMIGTRIHPLPVPRLTHSVQRRS